MFLMEIAGEVRARVNHDRWLCECPLPGCRGAELVSPDHPIFWCQSCNMIANGSKAMAVIFPPEKAEIDAVLMQRLDKVNRNWYPHETVSDLLRENAAHGIGA